MYSLDKEKQSRSKRPNEQTKTDVAGANRQSTDCNDSARLTNEMERLQGEEKKTSGTQKN